MVDGKKGCCREYRKRIRNRRVIYSKSKLALQESEELARFLDEIQYTCGDTFYDIVSNDTNDSMKKLFSIVKVNNTLTWNSLEIPYYSSGLFKEALCFNYGVECEGHNNHDVHIVKTVICQTKIKRE